MKTHFLNQTFQERLVHTMLATIALLVIAYAVVLLSVVFSAIERKQALLETRELTSSLSQVEQDYAQTLATITDAKLATHNFKRIDNSTFAVRKDPIATYSILYTR